MIKFSNALLHRSDELDFSRDILKGRVVWHSLKQVLNNLFAGHDASLHCDIIFFKR